MATKAARTGYRVGSRPASNPDYYHDDLCALETNSARIQAVVSSAVAEIAHFNAQELGNMTWALAKMELETERLMDILAMRAQEKIREYNTQNLGNTAWAFAKVDRRDAQFATSAAATTQWIRDFNPRNLADAK